MELYAMDTLYVLNAERENQIIPSLTANSTTCANCSENHPSYTRTCSVWKKEILTIKHTRNIPYPEAQKIVEGYIKNKTYSQISKKHSKSESKKGENDQELISKLLWPKFILEIKPILLKLSCNSTNPKPMTEYNLEKTSQFIETNPSKQPSRKEIRTISPHKNLIKKTTKPQKPE